APAPFTVSCSDPDAARGTARWNSDREWVHEFAADLPPGVRCSVDAARGFLSASGERLSGAPSYRFHTGGPFVQDVRPGTWQDIDEEQAFVLRLNGPATRDSLAEHVWCVADGVGERIPVRLIEGQARAQLLKATRQAEAAGKEPLRYATLSCARRLTA